MKDENNKPVIPSRILYTMVRTSDPLPPFPRVMA